MGVSLPSIEEQLSRATPSEFYPPFYRALRAGLVACNARGAFYWLTCGWRSFQASTQLNRAFKSGVGPRAAPAGESRHNFWIAADFTFDLDPAKYGLQPSWKAPEYAILGEEMQRLGLRWGGDWDGDGVRERGEDDLPHVEWPVWSIRGVRGAYFSAQSDNARQGAVFRHLDALCADSSFVLKYPKLLPFLQETTA
jgi:hypothetical protein